MLSRARYWAVQEPQERLAKLLRTYSWQDEAEQIWPSHLKTVPCEASGITIASEAATTAITSPAAAMRPRTRALPAGGVVRLFGSVVAEIVSRSFMILSVRESDAGLRARHHLCYTAMRNIIPPRDSPPSDAITALRSAGPDASRRARSTRSRHRYHDIPTSLRPHHQPPACRRNHGRYRAPKRLAVAGRTVVRRRIS